MSHVPLIRSREKNPPPASAAARLQARKQQLVRDAIWEAAIDLIDRQGFTETTIDEIAQAAGTSRRTFFRYFESKNDLMAQAVVSFGENLEEAIASAPEGLTPAEVFRHVVVTVAGRSVSYARTRKVMQIAAKYPAAREAQVARLAEVQDRVAAAFRQRYKGDAMDALTAQVLAALTLSTLSIVYQRWFEDGQQDVAATAERVFASLGEVVCPAETRPQARRSARISARRR